MLTLEERQQKAKQYKQLMTELTQYSDNLLRELPKDLQQKIRAEKYIQPITTSGLEHVTDIMNRLDWAIYYLTDPNFPDNFWKKLAQKKHAQTQPRSHHAHHPNDKALPQASLPTDQPIAPTEPDHPTTSPASEHQPLDFGPFDPRNQGQE